MRKKKKKRSEAIKCEAGSLFFICTDFQVLFGRINIRALKNQQIGEHRNPDCTKPHFVWYFFVKKEQSRCLQKAPVREFCPDQQMLASGQAGAARVLLQLPSRTRLKHLGVLTDQGWAPGFVQELEEEGAGSKGPCCPSSGCWFPSCPRQHPRSWPDPKPR